MPESGLMDENEKLKMPSSVTSLTFYLEKKPAPLEALNSHPPSTKVVTLRRNVPKG